VGGDETKNFCCKNELKREKTSKKETTHTHRTARDDDTDKKLLKPNAAGPLFSNVDSVCASLSFTSARLARTLLACEAPSDASFLTGEEFLLFTLERREQRSEERQREEEDGLPDARDNVPDEGFDMC
jgi:hypothetical protein